MQTLLFVVKAPEVKSGLNSWKRRSCPPRGFFLFFSNHQSGFRYSHRRGQLIYFFVQVKKNVVMASPWVLARELGHREAGGGGLLGLGVCRGLMAEFRLFRTAFGGAELRP